MYFGRLQNIKLAYVNLLDFLARVKREIALDRMLSAEIVDDWVMQYQNFMQNYTLWRNDEKYKNYEDLVDLYREVLFELEDKLFELRLKTGYAF